MSTSSTPKKKKPWRIWSDNATRFVPLVPTEAEDQALIQIALEQQPVEVSLRISKVLLGLADRDPDRIFLPTSWVEAELASTMSQTRE